MLYPSTLEIALDLVLRNTFPEPPPQSVVDAFLQHVRSTGQPETFPLISTTKPPVVGDVEVLAEKISINPKLRPNGDWAPCPICSPTRPKYFCDGTLIWCAHTDAIYAIGPRCSTSIWSDDRLQIAKNAFRRSQKEREETAALYHHVRRASAMSAWATDNLVAVRAAEAAHRGFAASMKVLRHALHRAIKTGGVGLRQANGHSVGWISGASFLSGSWRLERDIAEALKAITNLADEAKHDPQAWAEGLAPTLRREKLRVARSARQTLVRTAERVGEATAFLSESNVGALVVWSKLETAPIDFSVRHVGSKIELRQGNDRWEGPLGLRPATGVP